jgi:hypothetical protein
MSLATQNVDACTPVDIGSPLQFVVPSASLNLDTTVAASGSTVSDLILTNGYKNFAFGITSTQTGSVSIQRYIDAAGTIKQGSAVTGSLVANTALTVNSTDSNPYQSLIVTISNSGGSTATLSNQILLLQSY